MNGEFKKDYEPYQTMGPLSGIFDQRAAEQLNHHADMLGFDGISSGGVIAWLMECLAKEYLKPKDLGVKRVPIFRAKDFDVVGASLHNAEIGIGLLDAIIDQRGLLDLSQGARKLARRLARTHDQKVLDGFLYTAYARKGWMVPNQYWTPGVLSPMTIMGKYYMYYGNEFITPRELGRKNAERMTKELVLDNLGFCRFHRGWAEEMMPRCCRGPSRHEGGISRQYRDYRQSDQQPQLFGFLGVGTQCGLRTYLSETRTGCRRQYRSGTAEMARCLPKRQKRSFPKLLVRNA